MIYVVYLLTNRTRGTFYTGITSDLPRRLSEHKLKLMPGFSARYGIGKLVHLEYFEDVNEAIRFEKRFKRWHRDWKYQLVEKYNPDWLDLSGKYLPHFDKVTA